jgi:hypothetical protein
MVRQGVAIEVPPEEVAPVLADLLADSQRRADMGAGARLYVESGRGATEASARLVLDLLDGSPAR